MKHIYCIPGFGADKRVFSKVKFEGYETHFIEWTIPEKNESLTAYAKRLVKQIHHDKPILIGLSFGGMISIEISKLIPVEKIIIISSVKSFRELPLWMRLSGKLRLDRILPLKSFRIIRPIQDRNLGVENQFEKELMYFYRRNINQKYSNWAINKILNWNNEYVPTNLFHIHGSNDRIFPLKRIKPDYLIDAAGHLMIMNRADIVNEYINTILKND
jgi:pimeloyl-ACP methyl ester carboxylesterase